MWNAFIGPGFAGGTKRKFKCGVDCSWRSADYNVGRVVTVVVKNEPLEEIAKTIVDGTIFGSVSHYSLLTINS